MSLSYPLIFPAETRFFFLVGSMKSGTTWLSNLLDLHQDICSKGEMHPLEILDNPATVAPPTLESVASHAASLRQWLMMPNSAWNVPYREHADMHRTFWDLDRDYVRFFFEWTMMRYLRDTGREIPAVIGDKSPSHTPYLVPKLVRFFGDYRPFVLHIVRDPRDVAVSKWFHLRRLQHEGRFEFAPQLRDDDDRAACARLCEDPDGVLESGEPLFRYGGFLENNLAEWLTVNEHLARQAPRAFGERYVRVRYEDLKQDFDGTLRDLLARLGVDASDECVAGIRRRSEAARRPQVFRKGMVGEWQQWFRRDEHAVFDRVVGRFGSGHGYASPRPAGASA